MSLFRAGDIPRVKADADFYTARIARHQELNSPTPFSRTESLESNRNVTVCVRTRPVFEHESQAGEFNIFTCANPHIFLHEAGISVDGRTPKLKPNKFSFDHVFGPTDTNDAVFKNVGEPLLDFAMKGGISTIFAYGQTGSGKTYTISAIQERVSRVVFARARGLAVSLSYFEILGSKTFDLLNKRAELQILEDRFGGVNVAGARELVVEGARELSEAITRATAYRRTSATEKNDVSSRSHAVCKLTFAHTGLTSTEPGALFLVDLAGSETANDSKHHSDERFKETREINRSLMVLKECMRARTAATSSVGAQRHVHIPYRTSRLTLLLKQAFELSSTRHSHTVMFVMVSPLLSSTAQSMNTLKIAAPIKKAIASAAPPPVDRRNPANWPYDKIWKFLEDKSRGRIPPDTLLEGYRSGAQLCRMTEQEFISRCLTVKGITEKFAKGVYIRVWEAVIDSKTRRQRRALSGKTALERQRKSMEEDQRLMAKMSGSSARGGLL